MDHPLHELLYFGQLFLGLEQQLRVEISCPIINIHERVFSCHEDLRNMPHEHARNPCRLQILFRIIHELMQIRHRNAEIQSQTGDHEKMGSVHTKHLSQHSSTQGQAPTPRSAHSSYPPTNPPPQRSVRFCDGLGGCYRLFQRVLAWALEFDEQRVGFDPFMGRYPEVVRSVHEFVIVEFDAF
jgi:hypothetical protein